MPKPAHTERSRRSWRDFAFRAAVAKGARRSCTLCKRAMMGCAKLEIFPPWPTGQSKRRALCSECWREITTWVDAQEYVRDNYDKPIDWVCGKVTQREKMD